MNRVAGLSFSGQKTTWQELFEGRILWNETTILTIPDSLEEEEPVPPRGSPRRHRTSGHRRGTSSLWGEFHLVLGSWVLRTDQTSRSGVLDARALEWERWVCQGHRSGDRRVVEGSPFLGDLDERRWLSNFQEQQQAFKQPEGVDSVDWWSWQSAC